MNASNVIPFPIDEAAQLRLRANAAGLRAPIAPKSRAQFGAVEEEQLRREVLRVALDAIARTGVEPDVVTGALKEMVERGMWHRSLVVEGASKQ